MIEIEKRLTDDLHAALAGEPPLGFDPDEVADRAGRSRRKRRSAYLTAGAAAATTALAAVAVVVGSHEDTGRNTGVGTVTAPPSPTSAPAAEPAACLDIPPLQDPPLKFPGSARLLDRLQEAVPAAIAEHLPGGDAVERSDTMLAIDCPPRVVSGYFIGDVGIALILVHARPELDLAQDSMAGHVPLLDEFTAEDGALIRVYDASKGKDDPAGVRGLGVVRFGQDGMVSQMSVAPQDAVAVADAVALLSDPGLHFPIPH